MKKLSLCCSISLVLAIVFSFSVILVSCGIEPIDSENFVVNYDNMEEMYQEIQEQKSLRSSCEEKIVDVENGVHPALVDDLQSWKRCVAGADVNYRRLVGQYNLLMAKNSWKVLENRNPANSIPAVIDEE